MKKSVHAFLALPIEVFIVLEVDIGKNIYFGTSHYYANQVIGHNFYILNVQECLLTSTFVVYLEITQHKEFSCQNKTVNH